MDLLTAIEIVGAAGSLGGAFATGLWHAAMHVGKLTVRLEQHGAKLQTHEEKLDDHDQELRFLKGLKRA